MNDSVQVPVYKPSKDDIIRVYGSVTNITKDDICEVSKHMLHNCHKITYF